MGFSDHNNEFPPLDTSKILWNIDLDSSNYLTKDTFGPLVDKSINYLQRPQHRSENWLTERECATIKDFLDMKVESGTLDNLYRYANVFQNRHWTCKEHARSWIEGSVLEALEDFVHSGGGQVNLQFAAVEIELQSRQQADELCTLFDGAGDTFHISIKFSWNDLSRRNLDNFLQKLQPGTRRSLV